MEIVKRLADKQSAFSLEFFPPKKDMPVSSVYGAIEQLSPSSPVFVSVTYGAGGGSRERTLDIVYHVDAMGLNAIAHLTCAGANQSFINGILNTLEDRNIRNILALRGDVPEGMSASEAFAHYRHASDLISDIKARDGFTVAAAAYPEAHVESPSLKQDIEFMQLKARLGVDFFITQLCFDTSAIIKMHEMLYGAGISAPVMTGIMPVLNPKQIIRMSLLSACSIPASLSKIICLYGEKPDEFKKAGLDYAVGQISQLMDNGINKFHLYTMNKADEIEKILRCSRLI